MNNKFKVDDVISWAVSGREYRVNKTEGNSLWIEPLDGIRDQFCFQDDGAPFGNPMSAAWKLKEESKPMIDMSNNTKPFGLLSEEEQQVLRESTNVQVYQYSGRWRSNIGPMPYFQAHITYRVFTPPEPEDIFIPWEAVADNWQWAARDEDGSIYLYTEMPYTNFGAKEWYVSSADVSSVEALKGVKAGNKPWNESLIKRPEGV